MLGTFQQSNLRIEVNASEQKIHDSLIHSHHLRQWLYPQTFSLEPQAHLKQGMSFTSWIGPITIQHRVETAESNGLRLLMSQGVDGYHEWHWGEGWVQSCIAGVSLLPLNLGQTASLLRLQAFLHQS